MGAPEVILGALDGDHADVLSQANAYAADGDRVLLVAHLPADRMEPTMRADGSEQPSLVDERGCSRRPGRWRW